MLIGDKLHEIRKAKKMTLTELSDKSGVQLATLSRIENKKMTGTLESHIAIAKALDIEVVELYNSIIQEEKKIEVEETNRNSEVFTHNDRSSFEILTKNVLKKKMMPILLRVEEGGTTQAEQYAKNSERFIFILEGSIEVIIGKQSFKLDKHHTLYFDASLTHKFKNIGRNTAKIICVTTPVAL